MILKKIPSNSCYIQRYCRMFFPGETCVVFHRNTHGTYTYALVLDEKESGLDIVSQIKNKTHRSIDLTIAIKTIDPDTINSIQIINNENE